MTYMHKEDKDEEYIHSKIEQFRWVRLNDQTEIKKAGNETIYLYQILTKGWENKRHQIFLKEKRKEELREERNRDQKKAQAREQEYEAFIEKCIFNGLEAFITRSPEHFELYTGLGKRGSKGPPSVRRSRCNICLTVLER